jgi:hypothetical protein
MNILHGTWIPQATTDFLQSGSFYLWVETQTKPPGIQSEHPLHPKHLYQEKLFAFLSDTLGIKPPKYGQQGQLANLITQQFFLLPSAG